MMANTPGKKKTILHVIDALNIGGAQELLVLLADKTPKSAYQTLVCVIQPDVTLKSRIESRGAPVFCLSRSRPSIFCPGKFITYFYRNIRDIVSLCRQHRVDVVHCHLSDAEFIGHSGRVALWRQANHFHRTLSRASAGAQIRRYPKFSQNRCDPLAVSSRKCRCGGVR